MPTLTVVGITNFRFSLIAALQLQEHASWLRKAGMTPANPIRYATFPTSRFAFPVIDAFTPEVEHPEAVNFLVR